MLVPDVVVAFLGHVACVVIMMMITRMMTVKAPGPQNERIVDFLS